MTSYTRALFNAEGSRECFMREPVRRRLSVILVRLTPKASDVTENLRNFQRIDLRNSLPRVRLLRYIDRQVGIWRFYSRDVGSSLIQHMNVGTNELYVQHHKRCAVEHHARRILYCTYSSFIRSSYHSEMKSCTIPRSTIPDGIITGPNLNRPSFSQRAQ